MKKARITLTEAELFVIEQALSDAVDRGDEYREDTDCSDVRQKIEGALIVTRNKPS